MEELEKLKERLEWVNSAIEKSYRFVPFTYKGYRGNSKAGNNLYFEKMQLEKKIRKIEQRA